MTKQLGLFLLVTAVLVGSFAGSYARRNRESSEKGPMMTAEEIIDNANGNQAELARASDILKSETTLYPDNLSALFLQARAFQQRGLIDLALQSYDQYFTRKISSDFAANYNAGELSELKGDIKNAERYFLGCIDVAPKEPVGWERLIRLLVKEQRIDDAKGYFKSLQQVLPNSDVVKRLSSLIPE